MSAARAQFSNRPPDSRPATHRCPAGCSRPTSSLRQSPAAAVCTDAAALLRLGAAPEDARDACPNRKPFFPILRRQSGGPTSPQVCCASVARGVTGRSCSRLCDLALRHAASRCSRVLFRTGVLQRCGPRFCAAPPRPKMPAARAPFAKPCSRFSTGNASLPGRPLSPHVFFASVARGGGLHSSGGAVASRRGVRRCPRCVPFTVNCSSECPLATDCCPTGRFRPTSVLFPSLAASRGAVARAAAISLPATPHRYH